MNDAAFIKRDTGLRSTITRFALTGLLAAGLTLGVAQSALAENGDVTVDGEVKQAITLSITSSIIDFGDMTPNGGTLVGTNGSYYVAATETVVNSNVGWEGSAVANSNPGNRLHLITGSAPEEYGDITTASVISAVQQAPTTWKETGMAGSGQTDTQYVALHVGWTDELGLYSQTITYTVEATVVD